VALAALRDYLNHWWQIPLFLLYGGGWLIGGAYLTRRALGRYTDLPRSRRRLARCAGLNILSTGAGLVGGAIIAVFFVALVQRAGARVLMLGAVVVGVPAMLGMALAVGVNMLRLPVRTAWRVVLTTTGPLVVLLVAVSAGALVPAWFIRQNQVQCDRCKRHLYDILQALEMHAGGGTQAQSLKVLTYRGLIDPRVLTCPAKPGVDVGYLYAPAPASPGRTYSERIRVCDRRGNHGGVRMVLFTDGRVADVSESDLAKLLKKPENEAMARLVQADR
jgi:hypothetical protein